MVLDPKEYETSMWIAPAELLEGDFHPALKFAVASMRAAEKMRELMSDTAGMSEDMEKCVVELRERIFLYHPSDDGNATCEEPAEARAIERP